MKRGTRLASLALAALATVGAVVAASEDAHAIIGRPLTPVSFAGMARRTVRRTAYAGAAYGAAAYGAAAYYPPPAAVPVMPAGCVPGVACGGAVYQPAYSAGSVVYVPQ